MSLIKGGPLSGTGIETDPVFSGSPAAAITGDDISAWNAVAELKARLDVLNGLVRGDGAGNYSASPPITYDDVLRCGILTVN